MFVIRMATICCLQGSAAVISKPITIYDRLLATQLAEFYSTILLDFISSYTKFRLGQILKKAAFENSVGKLEEKLVNKHFKVKIKF